jgi:hypothetical protein
MQIYQYVRQDQSAHQHYLDALKEAAQAFSAEISVLYLTT